MFDNAHPQSCKRGELPPVRIGAFGKAAVDATGLFELAAWSNGTAIDQRTLLPGSSVLVSEARDGRTLLVIVCLDGCQSVESISEAGPLATAVAAGSVMLLDARDGIRLRVSGPMRIVSFGIQFRVLEQLIRRTGATRTVTAASVLECCEPFMDETLLGLARSVGCVVGGSASTSSVFHPRLAQE